MPEEDLWMPGKDEEDDIPFDQPEELDYELREKAEAVPLRAAAATPVATAPQGTEEVKEEPTPQRKRKAAKTETESAVGPQLAVLDTKSGKYRMITSIEDKLKEAVNTLLNTDLWIVEIRRIEAELSFKSKGQ